MATQSKVHYALQLRRRNETFRANAPPIASEYSPTIIPFSGEEVKHFNGTIRPSGSQKIPLDSLGRTAPLSMAPTGRSKLADAVGRHMAGKGFDALTSQMLTSYMLEHPAAVEQLRKELKAERNVHRKERALQAAGHKHVYPEELLFGGRTTAFPKAPMEESAKDLTSTRTGGPSKILEDCATTIEEERFELRPVVIFREGFAKSVSHRVSQVPSTTEGRAFLGDFFPTYVCQGIPVTFDPPTVATLTAQSGRATDAVVAQQTEDFGTLEFMPILEEVHALRAQYAAHVSEAIHPPRRSPTPQPSGAKDTRPRLEPEELDMMELQLSRAADSQVEKRHNPIARVVEAPEGLLKQLLREVDSDSEGSEDELVDQRCVICHTANAEDHSTGPGGKLRSLKRVPKSSLGSSNRAAEALLRWKAIHQLSQVDANASLNSLLMSRDEQSRIVRQNLKSLAEVSEKAKRDAEGWLRSRSGASPTPNNSCWTGPCHRIVQQRIRWQSCVKFWDRLIQFLGLLQWPQTESQLELIQTLQTIIEGQGYLSPCTLLFWLHASGPQLCKVREYYRVLVYVRAALGLPHRVLQAWVKLPSVRSAGFDLASD
ncbi:Hypothetical protein, putative [Bodo saltans]|uniref:Uncharacterized protein n=1 Tax=Bodo saltans TaxID=75058 RepID=A0A0S4ITZ1_BODSA|nr:Hypothetical protein, putative [Bodo saltans]|eukprot:CUG07569.1 Hypothetical protein, putative [Bodo saltans]